MPVFWKYGSLNVPYPSGPVQGSPYLNRLTPNDPYRGRTAPLTSKRCILYIYSRNTSTEYFKHGMYSTFFFSSSKCSLFHNSNVFGSSFMHVLYTGCAKMFKNNSGDKRLITVTSPSVTPPSFYRSSYSEAVELCYVKCNPYFAHRTFAIPYSDLTRKCTWASRLLPRIDAEQERSSDSEKEQGEI